MSGRDPRSIGQVLKGLGRITEEDIETALAYQREHGGFFGEALVACEIVSEEELEFGLASQFDLPYVFPEADAVDLEAASLVTPEWALANLTLPILRTGDVLKVVVDSPLKDEALGELRLKTDAELELGLASPSGIRELIRQVYARAAASDEEQREPLSLENTLDAVADAEASRWGLSIRGGRALAWWDDHGTVRRRPLAGDWHGALESQLFPPPSQVVMDTRTEWDAAIGRGASARRVTAHCIADESGREYLFVPREGELPLEDLLPSPPPAIVSEIRILARSGTARFAVTTDPADVGHEVLPHLPEMTLDPSWRSLYLNAADRPAAERSFSVKLPADPSTWDSEIEALRVFHFDVVTVDLWPASSEGPGVEARAWPTAMLDLAPVAFLLWPVDELDAATEAGVRWRLDVRRGSAGELDWSLESLES